MEARMNISALAPQGYKAVIAMENYLHQCGLDKKHIELIKIRASQINGCAFCINMHTKDALAMGETPQRIFLLDAWRETSLYSEEERVLLAMTEEITHISHAGLTDETFKKAKEVFDDAYIANIVLAIATINVWNRIAISSLTQPA
ncbi:carboxymuconolactone decarboxylase family protein [Sphingobacterium kyonggiense]